ncbi:MAG: hypothetical protein AAF554_09200 [Bacteroidota bacterium]
MDKKNKLLLGSFVALFFLCYQFGFKKTFAARSTYLDLSENARLQEKIPERLANLHQKNKALDAHLKALDLSGNSFQSDLLAFLNQENAKHRVVIKDFTAPHVHEDENGLRETYRVTLGGGFNEMLKTLHALELKQGFGSLEHVKLEKKRDLKTRKTLLTADVHIVLLK